MNTNNRRKFSSASRIALSVLAILASAADAQAVTEWDLPEQPLANTLRDIAARTESNIIFDKKLVKGQSAPQLKTRATTEEALSKVLEGTGLIYRQLDDKTVTIQLASTDPASVTSMSSRDDGRIRLAQAGTRAEQRAESNLPSVMLLEEIIVTGTNIRGIENTTVPVIVLDRAYIESSGISTTARLIESLPQNFATANQSALPSAAVSDARTQGSSVNLRGIGEGTTLVLINGRRTASGFFGSAVDISALPISAIERVEILSDGASALYGSDAVGGVVNFILRSDFEGAETRLRGGSADGADEYSASQMLGSAWESGNALFSVEYYKRDLLSVAERDFIQVGTGGTLVGSLLPEDENYSAMFTGRQDLGSSVTVFADALYTFRDSFNTSGQVLQNQTYATENPQLTATLGVEWRLGKDWQIETSGTYANYDNEQISTNNTLANFPTRSDVEFNIQAGRIKADGSLFAIPGGDVRAAIGGDYRKETFESTSVNSLGANLIVPVDIDQDVSSAFGELFIPIVGKDNTIPGVNRLEVSLAARYDDYSNFGSSFDPKYGIAWEPLGGVRLRASYGTSYVAPRLLDYNLATTRVLGVVQADPALGPTGRSSQIVLLGTDVATLQPQESDNLSLGLEFTPVGMPGFEAAINYYDIEYTDRIANPPGAAVILGNPAVYGSLFIRNPSAAQIAEAIRIGQLGGNPMTRGAGYNPNAVAAIVDQRRRNLSATNTSGVDISTRYAFTAAGNKFSVGLAGTYVLNLEQQVIDGTPQLDTVDTYANPPHWRARGSFGWQRGGLATNLFVNHTDSYLDNRVAATPATIDAYTTVDVRLSYDFSAVFADGVFSGMTVALGALNVADEDPPRTRVITGATDLGFDPANASPLGRLISIELTKTW